MTIDVEMVCHLVDEHRALGRNRTGRVRQVPVICALDMIEVVIMRAHTWTYVPARVTCWDLQRPNRGA